MNTIYKITIECTSSEVADAIRDYANRFNDDEVLWNIVTKLEVED